MFMMPLSSSQQVLSQACRKTLVLENKLEIFHRKNFKNSKTPCELLYTDIKYFYLALNSGHFLSKQWTRRIQNRV